MLNNYQAPQLKGTQIRQLSFIEKRLHLDTLLLLGLLIMSSIGLVVLYSSGNQNLGLIYKQLVRMGIAFTIMIAIARIHPDRLLRWAPWFYGAGIILLLAVLVVGTKSKGAQRWLNFGLFRFQPSEIMKLAVPMMVSYYYSRKNLPPSFKQIIVGSLIILIPTGLIAKQPDLGTSLLIASSGFFAIYFAGISWKLLLSATGALAAAAPAFWMFFMHEYQKQRVLTFLDPEKDPRGTGYHIIQSKIAIGSGGTYGKGWLNGTQSQLDFLPERSTDFIFSAFSEEFGLIGICILLLIYFLIIVRGLYIAAQAQDTFARLLCGSLMLTFFVYIFVNIGMVSGLLPVVGLPLPLVSYGGTSMVTIMAGFGIMMSIHTHRKLYSS